MLKRISVLLFDGIASKLTGFVVFPVYATVYGPVLFGSLSFVLSLTFILSVLATFGQSGILVRDISDSRLAREEVIANYAVVRITSTIISIVFLYSTLLLTRINEQEKFLILSAGAFLGVQSAYTFFISILHGHKKTKEIVALNQFNNVSSSTLKYLSAVLKFNIIFYFISQLFTTAVALSLMLKRFNILLKFGVESIKIYRLKILISECFVNFLSAALTVLYLRVDVLMMRSLSSPIELGSYSFAVSLSEASWFIPASISTILLPYINTWYNAQNRKTRYYKRSNLIILTFLMLSIAFVLVYLATSTLLDNFFYDRGFRNLEILVMLLSAAIPVVFVSNAVRIVLITERMTKILIYSNLCGLLLNIFLNMLIIPKYGSVGAAYSTIISYFVANFFIYFCFSNTRLHLITVFSYTSISNLKLIYRLIHTYISRVRKD